LAGSSALRRPPSPTKIAVRASTDGSGRPGARNTAFERTVLWWDYRNLAFRKNQGRRIDHVLAGPALQPRVQACNIDNAQRRNEWPSDHAPAVVEIG
jgi:hypothetical protein